MVLPRHIVRAWVVASLTLATWLTASSAWATAPYAPLCDDRGASVIAPPPTFEATDVAIRRAHVSSCGYGRQSLFASILSGRNAASFTGHSVEPALPPSGEWAPPLISEPLAGDHVDRAVQCGGRSRVERPPR